MSDFEKDFVSRCYEYLCVGGQMRPPPACRAFFQPSKGSSETCVISSRAPTTWQPFFDLVVLPGGCVCLGWFHQHPLDKVWINYTMEYVADLWHRSPGALYLQHQERVHDVAYAKLQHRQRNLRVFLPALQVKADEATEDYQRAIRVIYTTSRNMMPLENTVLQRCSSRHVTVADVRSLLELIAQRIEPLSTGTAVALLQMLVSTYALHSSPSNGGLVDALRAAAVQVCSLTRDSNVSLLLSCAASLLGGEAATSARTMMTGFALPVSEIRCSDVAQALSAVVCGVLSPSGAQRNAVLRHHIDHFLSPLCGTLLSEEAVMVDTLCQEHRDLDNTNDIAAAATLTASRAALRPTQVVAGDRSGVIDGDDGRHLIAVLKSGRAIEGVAESKVAPAALQQRASTVEAPIAWMPGTGIDLRGCWCAAFTLSVLLTAQVRLHQYHSKGDDGLRACATAAKEGQHVLRITLIRRCTYITTPENMSSQYSMLTHLASTMTQLPVSLTLLHLTSTSDGETKTTGGCDPCYTPMLMGLLFLFPTLELRSFFGGTTQRFLHALSSGTRSFPCYVEPVMGSSAAADTHVETVHVPDRFSQLLLLQLKGRDAAVVCVVHSGLAVKDVFLAEDVSSHLHCIMSS
jgi:hypothetical protein